MNEPFVSVIVPVRNEERYIERCLYSIARQDYPRSRLEVIVADGMSDDATRAVVSRFAAESTIDLRLVDNLRRSPAAAMNTALPLARGDVIVRVDGHAALAPDYVRLCVDALQRMGADCAGGGLDSEGDTYAGRAIAAAMSSRLGVGGAAFRVGGAGPVDTVAFGAYRADVFDRIGGFDEDLVGGEDDEFNYRLRDAGGTIVLVPEARAAYVVRGSIAALWRQYYRYGRAKPEVLALHPRQVQLRQLAPPALVAAASASAILAMLGRPGACKALSAVYAGGATFGSLVIARRRGWRYFPPIAAAVVCLHVSYGAGFLSGALGLAARAIARRAQPGARQSTEAPRERRA